MGLGFLLGDQANFILVNCIRVSWPISSQTFHHLLLLSIMKGMGSPEVEKRRYRTVMPGNVCLNTGEYRETVVLKNARFLQSSTIAISFKQTISRISFNIAPCKMSRQLIRSADNATHDNSETRGCLSSSLIH